MNSWSFTTESYPDHHRLDAWRDLLARLSVETRHAVGVRDIFATAHAVESPLGIIFAQIVSGPQKLSYSDDPGMIWLALHSDGQAVLSEAGRTIRIAVGDLVYGTAGAPAELQFATNFRQLLVRIPRAAIGARLVGPLAPRVGRLLGGGGLGGVFARLLASVADMIDTIDADTIRPIEVALAEFLTASLAGDRGDGALVGATASRAATLHRICQKIEARLGDPDLALSGVAEDQGVSMRYLQKLFESAGSSFGQYVRQRRLEQCRLDLINPLYAGLSITDICFRWGFNDAAHFSRAFSEHFGEPPRNYRRETADKVSEGVHLQMVRGWPLGLNDRTRQPKARRALAPASLEHGAAPVLDVAAPGDAAARAADSPRRHHLPATDKTVHWGYFSKISRTHRRGRLGRLRHHRDGDAPCQRRLRTHGQGRSRARKHLPLEDAKRKGVDRRGAGPMDASLFGRGAGEGLGVHICTGPVAVKGAEPGDIRGSTHSRRETAPLRRSSRNTRARHSAAMRPPGGGSTTRKNMIEEPKPREVITIYEESGRGRRARLGQGPVQLPLDAADRPLRGRAQNDRLSRRAGRPQHHQGKLGRTEERPRCRSARTSARWVSPPAEADIVDSIPPSYTGGNIDNWRISSGATMYYPVSVKGGLFSVGDPHASRRLRTMRYGNRVLADRGPSNSSCKPSKIDAERYPLENLDYPLLETQSEWVVPGFSLPNYLAEFGSQGADRGLRQVVGRSRAAGCLPQDGGTSS